MQDIGGREQIIGSERIDVPSDTGGGTHMHAPREVLYFQNVSRGKKVQFFPKVFGEFLARLSVRFSKI